MAAEKFRSYFEAVEAEIIIDDKMLLNNYGFAGEVIHTPGHGKSFSHQELLKTMDIGEDEYE